MSTAPANNLTSNKMTLTLIGVVGGIGALCSGFFVMALVTFRVMNRDTSGAYAGVGPTATSSPARSTQSDGTGHEAEKAVEDFLKDLRDGNIEAAHSRTTNDFRNGEEVTAFRTRMQKIKALRGYRTLSLSMVSANPTAGTQKWRGSVDGGPFGKATVAIDVELANDGWRVSSFSAQ
jgi:hypothetical protein